MNEDIVCLTLRDNTTLATGTKADKGEVIAIKRGFKGYCPTSYGVQDRNFVEVLNREKFGIAPEKEDAYVVISIFGNWEMEEKILENFLKRAS